jgi:hypothetical protein
MIMRRALLLLLSHGIVLAMGFVLGIYALPILTAPPSPGAQILSQSAQGAQYSAEFVEDLRGNDALH